MASKSVPGGVAAGLRRVGAVVGAMVLVVALMIGTNLLLVRWIAPGAAVFLAVTLALAAMYHTLGGYLCAVLARGARSAAVGVVGLGAAIMLGSVIQTWPTVPPWYSIAMLAIAPSFLWIGSQRYARPRG
ncbi:MAG TPA: hypothetical protein VMV31_03920 [Terriglobales bacterium]|nr:hypothetical protein [Terriglobales bacterium]